MQVTVLIPSMVLRDTAGGIMPAYTVYRLNGTSRISEPPNYIAADTDEEAIEFARDKKLKVRCEVWEGVGWSRGSTLIRQALDVLFNVFRHLVQRRSKPVVVA